MKRVSRFVWGAACYFITATALAIPLSGVLPGQLLINELMPNPAGDDTTQEWFEVRNQLPVVVDLTGMIVDSNNGRFIVGSGNTIAANGFFLFARSSDPALNGGLPPVGFAWGQLLNLGNTSGQLALKQADESIITGLQEIEWVQ